jgi:hypothetical protein
MAQLIGYGELPNNGSVQKFEGYLHGEVDVSFFLSDTAPARERICTGTPTTRSSWCKRAS